jgi:hypothetical protein
LRATHFISRETAAFGQPDPSEVCDRVVASIPAATLRNATRILDPAIGCCGIARAVVKRLVNELDVPFFDATLRVYGVDTDLALVKKARRLGFINTVHADFLTWQPEMQFDVVIGNPPYQAPKNANGAKMPPLWKKFIKVGAQHLKDGGFLSYLVPSQVAKFHEEGKPSPALQKVPELGVSLIETGMERYFNVGSEITLISFVKGAQSDTVSVNGSDWNWAQNSWVPVKSEPELTSVLLKLFSYTGRLPFFIQSHSKELFVDPDKTLGCWGMNRGKNYGFIGIDSLEGKPRKVHLMCAEFKTKKLRDTALMLFESPVYAFIKQMTMFGSDVSFKTLSALPIPEGWESIKASDDVADLFNLTDSEKDLISSFK